MPSKIWRYRFKANKSNSSVKHQGAEFGAKSSALSTRNSSGPNLRLLFTGETCWFVTAFVSEIAIEMLVDTGSATSLLSRKIFDQMKNPGEPLCPTEARLSTASGNPMNVFREVDVGLRVVRMFTTRTVVIAELGDIEGILGLDYLEDNKAMFDILYTRNGDIKLHREKLGDLIVCIREDVVIPPNSEMCILGAVGSAGLDIDRHESSWIVEPNTSLHDGSPLVIGRSLVDVSRGDLPMVVINTSCESVTLRD